jgi:hypothetical protein
MIALLFLLLLLAFSSFSHLSQKVFLCRAGTFCALPWHKTFCAVLWHILCRPVAHFVPSLGTFCAVLWHILCLPVEHKPKSLFVSCYGTFCAFPWLISLKVFLCRAVHVAHFVPSRVTWNSVPSCQELQVKNCKSRIAKKKSFRQFGHFFISA